MSETDKEVKTPAEIKSAINQAIKARSQMRKPKNIKKREPKTKPLDYNKESTHPLLTTIKNLQADYFDYNMGIDELTEKYADFFFKYKELFNSCINRRFGEEDYKHLGHMMSTHEKVLTGEITYTEASKQISRTGAKLYQPELLKQ